MNAALLESSGVALSWMLTYLIHSTILILSVWLLCRGIKPIARRIGPGGENLAWKLALVGAFVTATVQISAGITPALGALEFTTAPQLSQSEVAAEPAKVSEVANQAPVVIRVHPSDQPVMLQAGPPSVGPIAPLAPLSQAAAVVEREAPPAAPVWPFVVLAVWGLGTLIASGRLLLSVRSLRKRLADREEVIVDPVLETFLTLCRDAEIKRKIRLTQSTQIESPIALWRREVVVPQRAVEELSPAAMRSVLAHELAHLERRDPHWLAFAAVLEVLCFFQPLNRLARRGMQESAELLCDDWAIGQTGDAVQFAKSLAELASWNQMRNHSRLVAGMVSGDRPLVQRVRRALDGDPRRFKAEEGPRPTRMLLGLSTLAALIMVAPGAVDASAPPKAEETEAKAKAKESKAERKARKAREKAEKEAAKAEAKAREAQAKAEQAQREAEEAMRAAERARSQAEASMRAQNQGPLGDGQAQGQQHLVIRDGENYLIVDGRGIQLRGEGADVVIIDGENPRVKMRIDDGQTQLDLDIDAESIESFVEDLVEGEGMELGELLEGMEALGGLEGLGALGGMDPREMEEIAREMEAMQREMQGVERELVEELLEEGFDGFFGPGFPQADAESIERETEREMRRAERELERLIEQQRRELEQHQRELERHRRELERHQRRSAPRAPRAPVTPQVAPPAPPAAPAPVVAI